VDESQTDTGTFEELALPLLARLYNLARWLTQDAGEAEELVQESCMKALRGFGSYRQGTNFSAWIYRIMRNTFLTSRAGLKYSTISLDDEESDVPEPATVGTPETALLATFNQQAIQSALEVLPLHFREVILLCDVEEMSYQAIAEALAIPIGTVMSRLSRARRAMRAQLADEPGNPRPRRASR